MHKSIFIKYFTVFTTLSITCVSVMGLIFVSLAFKQIMIQEHVSLDSTLQRTSKEISYNYDYDKKIVVFDSMQHFFETITSSNQHLVFVTDVNGEIIYSTGDELLSLYVESSILDVVLNDGLYTEFGKLGDIFSSRAFNAGIPIYTTEYEDKLIGFVFGVSEDYLDNDTLLNDIVNIFIYCALIALTVTFIAVYFITHQMVKPLRDMSDASKRFAVGDFSQKINVTSVDEIGQLAMAMNNMALALEVSENAHKSFVANVSHELRTPMTSISGFVDGILDGTIPKEKEVHYLNIVSDEVKRLSRLVRTMLNLSRIENRELVLETSRINVIDIICETLFSFEREIERKNIRLEGLDHEKVYVMIDYDLIHQVVYNLIENAVKFVDEGGYIKFTYTAQVDSVIIGIENSGPGLSKDEIPKIFERFYKTDSSRGIDKNGVGLGLHIVRSIVNLHQGEIMVQSVEGKYCKFSFNLPSVKYDINF